jgi:hypothetical protein
MNKNVEWLYLYLENLSKQQKGIFTLSLKTVGNDELLLTLPNVGNHRFCKDSIKEFATAENLLVSVELLTKSMITREIPCPVFFLKSGITALGLDNGYGSISLEYLDKKTFIGTIALSYRGSR